MLSLLTSVMWPNCILYTRLREQSLLLQHNVCDTTHNDRSGTVLDFVLEFVLVLQILMMLTFVLI